MYRILKYSNIENELPNLVQVLRDALQSDFLNIRLIDKSCDKYIRECGKFCTLAEAKYVIFSPHVKKEDHKHEVFVFIDETGNTLCHVGGGDMDLHGLIQPISNLELSEEYKSVVKHKS